MIRNRDREKLIQVIVFFAKNTRFLGKIKLFKLLYLLDFEHFRLTGRNVTGLDYHAWKFGPVPVALNEEWDELEPDLDAAISIEPKKVIDHVRETVSPKSDFDGRHFTKRELRLMTETAAKYRDVSAPKMIDVTHAENGAWAKVWKDGDGQNKRIAYTLALSKDDPNREAILQAAKEYEAVVSSAQH